MSEYSFQNGWSQLRQKDMSTVRKKITDALEIKETNRASWGQRMKGIVEPKVSEAKAIEEIFAEYGIIEVWGAE
jgi:Tfp pilus assembly protein PilF